VATTPPHNSIVRKQFLYQLWWFWKTEIKGLSRPSSVKFQNF